MTREDFDRAQVVILSSIEWGATWQRHQAFASQWAAAGHEVYFVENTGFRDPALSDLPRLGRRAARLLFERAKPGMQGLPERIRLINPLVLPPRRRGPRALNAAWFVPMLADQLRAAGLRPGAVAVAYLPTTTTLQLLDALAPSLVVYDCVDNFYGLPSVPPDLAETEGELMRRSALVLTTSSTLYDDKAGRHPHVVELHHGVSPAFFLPPRRLGTAPRACYFGTLWRAVDYEPLRALAEAGFAVDLIGPQKEAPPPLPAGVRFLPPLPHERLAEALAEYDALLLPYVADEYNRGVIPAKLYECLATGRPVIASPLPALERLSGLVTVARSPGEWVAALRGLSKLSTPEAAAARVAAAREHAQEPTFARLRGLVRAAWEEADPPSTPPESPGRHIRAFLRGFSWIGILYGMAKVSTLVTQVMAGRWLGPLQFGQANLVIAAAAYLQIAPMLGFPVALARFLAAAETETERRGIISTALLLFFVWGGLCLAALSAARSILAPRLGLPLPMVELALVFAYATAGYTVISSPLLGLKRFDHRGLAEALYGLSAPVLLLLFVALGRADFVHLVLAFSLSLAAGTLYSLWVLRGYLSLTLHRGIVWPLARYAAMASLNFLAAACILAPARLILNHVDSAHEVGVFSAYFTATVQLALAVLTMATAVIVPIASTAEGQSEAWKAFRRWRLPLWLGAWALFMVAAGMGLLLFGRQYRFHIEWILLFAGAASLALIHGLTSALYSARDFSGLSISVTGSLAAGLGNAALSWWLVPRWGITGAGLSLAGGFALGLAVYALPKKQEAA